MQADLIAQLHTSLHQFDPGPTAQQLEDLCDMLYGASLLREEGRPVRSRVVIAPPDVFAAYAGPPEGIQALRFAEPAYLCLNEIKRLSPSASFFHSALAVWPDDEGNFLIWGILNTGLRWMNAVAGGRKPSGQDFPFPSIHVRDPGLLLFYKSYELITEWRGRQFKGPGLNVFEANVVKQRFDEMRLGFVRELGFDQNQLPSTLSAEVYSELLHLVATQFIRRIVNLMRGSGHGGSLILLPGSYVPGNDPVMARWIDCKYSVGDDGGRQRFGRLMLNILGQIGAMVEPGATLEEAWRLYMSCGDPGLDELEESLFELARLYSDMMQVDGALILDHGLNLVGFGGEIRVPENVTQIYQAHDLEATDLTPWSPQSDGTRHRSVYRLCCVEREVIGIVISQDGLVRTIANLNGDVVFWLHAQY